MKGISPLVATVLLVALVVGIGGLVSLFATSLTTTSTGITQNQSISLSRCAGAWINVYKVTNSTIFYSNPTNQPLTGLVAIYGDGKQSLTILDQNLIVGESNFTQITNETGSTTSSATATVTGIAPGGTAGNTSVVVRGLCQTLVTVEGRCKQGQDCWQGATA